MIENDQNDSLNTQNAVVVEGIVKSYKHGRKIAEILHSISFKIPANSFVAITGPSGSGKTTLMRLLGGISRPDKGVLELLDSNIYSLSDSRRSAFRNKEIGFIFQDHRLISHYDALHNVMVPLKISGRLPSSVQKQRAKTALRLVGLEGCENSKIDDLSGGQQQRIGIARAIVTKPSLLLADEPTGNLDVRTGNEIVKVLRRIQDTYGMTIIMVTHSEELASKADMRIRIVDGRIAGALS